ncbi:hypothetical protein [Kibdelosporangium phytohabitans]|uniref:Uncharacterized protein n=1 Tax=Kibdelosporangium phytohabitans TaxID=860235 RepID=A0A0N9HVZ0_9PSEU|nr:hypothetical protein [Kibdelosporangium phytohabitans]ALG11617.1 hypothetical protein AOZ06_36345 [Kibdelosporangium phytohabitans]MBE1462992.1 acyl-coenzyme A synthetase/AMP-(fatty) acid ligase [Kibdelosporangium phytohabitans]
MVDDARATTVITDLDELSAAAKAESADLLPVVAREEDIARVLDTSGTTGLPPSRSSTVSIPTSSSTPCSRPTWR